jgi:hypothetical protein
MTKPAAPASHTAKPKADGQPAHQSHEDEALDEALEESFPSSDPVAVSIDPPVAKPPSPPKR